VPKVLLLVHPKLLPALGESDEEILRRRLGTQRMPVILPVARRITSKENAGHVSHLALLKGVLPDCSATFAIITTMMKTLKELYRSWKRRLQNVELP
jgi:hypothetical protein